MPLHSEVSSIRKPNKEVISKAGGNRLKLQEIFFKHLDAIVEIVNNQLEAARGEGHTVGVSCFFGQTRCLF